MLRLLLLSRTDVERRLLAFVVARVLAGFTSPRLRASEFHGPRLGYHRLWDFRVARSLALY